jgi:hypothetical protein
MKRADSEHILETAAGFRSLRMLERLIFGSCAAVYLVVAIRHRSLLFFVVALLMAITSLKALKTKPRYVPWGLAISIICLIFLLTGIAVRNWTVVGLCAFIGSLDTLFHYPPFVEAAQRPLWSSEPRSKPHGFEVIIPERNKPEDDRDRS